MPSYAATALVLRRTKLGEADLILTMLDSSGRIVRAVAKGARKPKSRLAGVCGLFVANDFLLHQGKNLDVVGEARTVFRAPHVVQEYRATLAASAVAEFVLRTHWAGQEERRLYEMTRTALEVLDGCAASPERTPDDRDDAIDAVALAYLIKGLAMLGYRPTTDGCAECGTPLALCGPEGSPATTACWSPDIAGIRCATCAPGAPASTFVPLAAVEWLGVLLNSTFDAIASSPPHAAALTDIFALVSDLLATHGDAKLNSFDALARERFRGSRVG